MESMDSHTAPDATHDAAVRHPFVDRGLRRLSSVTVAAGVTSTAASVATVLLSRDPGYVRALLSSRDWGTAAPTDAEVAAAQTGTLDAVLVGAILLAITAVLLWLVNRPWPPVRWIGTACAVMGVLTAAFWAVDGGTMVLTAGTAGGVVLALVGAMLIACALWLLVAHWPSVREALDG